MAHIGKKLRLVLARFGKLPEALVLDFVEQPHILNRDSAAWSAKV